MQPILVCDCLRNWVDPAVCFPFLCAPYSNKSKSTASSIEYQLSRHGPSTAACRLNCKQISKQASRVSPRRLIVAAIYANKQASRVACMQINKQAEYRRGDSRKPGPSKKGGETAVSIKLTNDFAIFFLRYYIVDSTSTITIISRIYIL